MKFELPQLPYAYDALEPYIDAKTMELHHAKHHQTYVTKLNEALADHPELQEMSLEELLKSCDTLPESVKIAVRNHGGGHANHSLFWKIMKAGGGGEPAGHVATAIQGQLGGFAVFKEEFNKKAVSVFG